ncbi:hypothetical protein [Streptomyces litchfieldiae]|uniref:Secreted protein n=1 Tax=Streptomyces litchfieldiae TaxID=3075543 RepID=A0ABU2MY46_9ACTN|nr:hypothetical protein [Streptomyces sp. DSM 44938]MDT0346450.1 hypothetical protein [Streptomyces sp. DSM 44938]
MTIPDVSRRTLLARSSALAGATFLASVPGAALLAAPAYADSSSYSKTPTGEEISDAFRRVQENQNRVRAGRLSPNGWEMEKTTNGGGNIWTRPTPGTPLTGVTVRIGDAEAILIHVIRRFHYEISELRNDDVTGWRSPSEVRRNWPEGNQASGTAVQIRPGFYPAGTSGGFSHLQLLVIRDILAELDGAVRWGGDDRHLNESLFYLDVGPDEPRLAEMVEKIRAWGDTPGRGAGAPVDVLAADRRRAAEALERRQSGTAA